MEQTTLRALAAVWACSINKAIVFGEKALNKSIKQQNSAAAWVSVAR